MLQEIAVPVAQVEAGNTFENLLIEIRQTFHPSKYIPSKHLLVLKTSSRRL